MEVKDTEMKTYILSHLNQAIEEGWIRPYFQPVVRTVSRKMCSVEALARWEDPEKELLPPNCFIPILEQNKEIHRLDCCIVRQICQLYRKNVLRHEEVVPCSFNLSRLDFELCDIFSYVEENVKEYEIPREMLHIEITESALSDNPEEIKKNIARFQNAGYQVWMDDFGDGYSSLNTLKDYKFDELKIDMVFLRNFNFRSRTIIRSVVDMAKEIHIQTLAEGVETEEQFFYLKNIGCEKVQGYLFGKPMPWEVCVSHMREQNVAFEKNADRKYYDDIGKINVLGTSPLANIQSFDEKASENIKNESAIPLTMLEIGSNNHVQYLYMNTALKNELQNIGISDAETSITVLRREYPILDSRLDAIMEFTKKTGSASTTVIENGQYFNIRTRLIAQNQEVYTILFTCLNLTQTMDLDRKERMDILLRDLYALYKGVFLIHIEKNRIEELFLSMPTAGINEETGNFTEEVQKFDKERVYSDDRQRFLQFFDKETMEKRIRKSSTGFISLYLRLKGLKGDYFWNFIIAFLTENGEILLLIRDTDDSWKPTKKDIFSQKESSTTTEPAREKIDDEVLWKSLMNGIGVGIFWKDRQRRFCGANQMFLDYYGLHSVEEILGKTDEDMGWHVNPDPYRDDELAVIQEGKVTRDVPGRCLVHGVNRDIMASKMPLYKAGKIVGLVGQFRDVTDTKDTAFVAARETTDEITGLLNYNGFKEVKMRYIDEWNFHGVQFQAMAVGIDNFMELRKLYGDEFSLMVMRAAAERLKEVCGTKCAIARFSGSEFAILLQTEEPEKMNHLAEEIERSIAHIHVLNGTACSLYLSIGIADSTMTEPENVQKAAFEKMKQKQKEHTEKFS